jgi:hypothetical protein
MFKLTLLTKVTFLGRASFGEKITKHAIFSLKKEDRETENIINKRDIHTLT